uniref:Uncharacterized protein n=1 Tax=Meloidogyne javanica TaxID=6303 RepID=A0A915M695_MELJA
MDGALRLTGIPMTVMKVGMVSTDIMGMEYTMMDMENMGIGDMIDDGHAAGYAKGDKSDWSNYQYGGQGNKAQGDSYAKGYNSAWGDGHVTVGDPTVDIMMTNIGTVMEEMDIGEVMEDIVTMEGEDMVMEEDMDIEYYY